MKISLRMKTPKRRNLEAKDLLSNPHFTRLRDSTKTPEQRRQKRDGWDRKAKHKGAQLSDAPFLLPNFLKRKQIRL